MANVIGAIGLIIAIALGIGIWMFSRQAKKTGSHGWRHNVLYNARTGFECELATNPTQPDDLIQYDPNTKKAFVRRERGFFDRAEDRIFLGDDFFDSKGLYSGWRIIIVDVSVFNEFNLKEAQKWRKKWFDLIGTLDVIKAENLKLKAFMKGQVREDLKLMTDTHKDMITYFDPKKAGTQRK